MIGLDKYGGKSKVLLGFFLLVNCVPLVKTIEYSSLDATTLSNECSGVATPPGAFYPASKYAFPIDPAVTWMANRTTPLSSAAALSDHPNGTLEFFDHNQNSPRDICYNMDFASTKLQNSGKLVLKNRNGTEAWKDFDYSSPPTDTATATWPALPDGRPDPMSNVKTLKRITMSGDGGFRILQCIINQTVPLNVHRWKAMGKYRPDYPTVALNGTNRISYLRNQVVEKLPESPAVKKDNRKDNKKDNNCKWVRILAATVGILGVLLIIVAAIFCLRRYENVQQRLWACGSCGLCYRRPNKPRYEIKFPGDTPVRTEPEDESVELEPVEERRGPRCHCAVSCVMSFNHSGSPES